MSTRGSSAFGSRGRGRGAQSAAGGTREPLTTSNIPPSRGRGRGRGRAGASAASSTTPRAGAQSRNTSASYTTPGAAFNTTNNSASATATATASSDRVEIDLLSDEDDDNHGNSRRDKQRGGASTDEEMAVDAEEEEEGETRKTIPPELLTRLLHAFFEKDETRITRDANDAVAKYVDVFVREAIARAAVERRGGGFLEVEDLEKIAPQLLLDL
ncbi:centromere X protein [Rhypophila sp. PSN 637]